MYGLPQSEGARPVQRGDGAMLRTNTCAFTPGTDHTKIIGYAFRQDCISGIMPAKFNEDIMRERSATVNLIE